MAGEQVDRNEEMHNIFIIQMKAIYFDRISRADFWKFYTLIMEYCVKGKEVSVWLDKKDQHPECEYKQLHEQIKEFLNDYMTDISTKAPDSDEDEVCLAYYCKVWNKFRLSSKILNAASMYLNKQYHKKYTNAETVEQIALHAWKEHLFAHLNERVANAALRMLEQSRQGKFINEDAIKAVVASYIELGLLEAPNDAEDTHLTVYKLFEQRVLEGTKEFYIKENSLIMEKYYTRECSFVRYMQYVKKRIEEEMKDRAKLLHITTEKLLVKVLSDISIMRYIDTFDTEFRVMLEQDKTDDMALMYILVVKSTLVLERMNEIFEEHVTKVGFNKIQNCADEAVKDPRLYIETILSVHNKYCKIVKDQFKCEIGFSSAIDKACIKFINKNSVIDKSNDINKSPELLAAYCHMLLKKSSKNLEEAALEEALNQILVVFRYIEDKDVFEAFYKKRLAERLVEHLSASDDAEASMISKMKQVCGSNYTNKLQRMYQDIEVSKGLNENFRKVIATGTPIEIDFRVKVLTHGSWPFHQSLIFTPPPELTMPMEKFKAFYNAKQSGRKLTWLFNRSKGELIMHSKKQRYTIKANTFQISILLQFNDQPSLSAKDIQEQTGIEMTYVTQMLAFLVVKTKILKSTDNGNITENSIVNLNTEYREPKLRFDITVRMKSEQAEERNATQQGIEDDRRHLIDAAIVRIMKMRKTLNHQELISEVLTQLSPSFKPKISAIKKCIDRLIEKEYLERHPTQMQTYNYLA